MLLAPSDITSFRQLVWDHFHAHERSMPWRDKPTPYYVLVSELMLQQTQVARVIPKFEQFIAQFPDFLSLAHAPLGTVLQAWSGLGYNRRAKFLHNAAQQVAAQNGVMPATPEGLMALPGVGPNTAGAIMAYAYNCPVIFIETNIRTVYLHHFFADTTEKISDETLRKLVEMTLDHEHPRQWYWALMDYGTYLKKTAGGRLEQSQHYKKQAPLKGSLREMRGRIVRQLTYETHNEQHLRVAVQADERFDTALHALQSEGLVERVDGVWRLTGHNQAS